jgi:hypothetical protein
MYTLYSYCGHAEVLSPQTTEKVGSESRKSAKSYIYVEGPQI